MKSITAIEPRNNLSRRGVLLRGYDYGGQAGAQRLRLIWSAAANGIPSDAAFMMQKSGAALAYRLCLSPHSKKNVFFVLFVCFVGNY
jgi:hypothetical protein